MLVGGKFDIGDRPAATFNIFDATGAAADPTTVKIITKNPAGTETVYVYSVATEITKTATGTYVFQFPQFTSTQAGTWTLRCNGSGGVTSSFEDTFVVNSTAFTTPLP